MRPAKNTLPCRYDSFSSARCVCFLFSVGRSAVQAVSLMFTVLPLMIRNFIYFIYLIFQPILISTLSQHVSDIRAVCSGEASENHLVVKFKTMRESSITLTMQTS